MGAIGFYGAENFKEITFAFAFAQCDWTLRCMLGCFRTLYKQINQFAFCVQTYQSLLKPRMIIWHVNEMTW